MGDLKYYNRMFVEKGLRVGCKSNSRITFDSH